MRPTKKRKQRTSKTSHTHPRQRNKARFCFPSFNYPIFATILDCDVRAFIHLWSNIHWIDLYVQSFQERGYSIMLWSKLANFENVGSHYGRLEALWRRQHLPALNIRIHHINIRLFLRFFTLTLKMKVFHFYRRFRIFMKQFPKTASPWLQIFLQERWKQ